MRFLISLSVLLVALLTTSVALACSIAPPVGIAWPRADQPLPANANIVFESDTGVAAILVNGEPSDIDVEDVPSWFYQGSLLHTAGHVVPGDVVEVVPGDVHDDGSYMRLRIQVVAEDPLPHVEEVPSAQYFYRHTGAINEGDGGASCGPGNDWDTEVSVLFDLPSDGKNRLIWTTLDERSFGVVTPEDMAYTTDIYTDPSATPPCVTVVVDDLHGGRWTEQLCQPDLCAVGPNSALPPSATVYGDAVHPAWANDWESVPEDSCDDIDVDVDDRDDDQDDGEDADDSLFDDVRTRSGRGSADNCGVQTSRAPTSWLSLFARR
jgi:hypothetical protein